MARAQKEPSFEQDLERLESIVTALEEGGLPLDDSLKRFEEGIKLARRCEKTLSEAEKKIEILTKNAQGNLEAAPFDETSEELENRRTADPVPAEEETVESEDEDEDLLF